MNKSSYIIVIPARYASERLPGKMLADIAGRPMIQHVWEAAQRSSAQRVVIATDDERIREVADGFGAECVMTNPDHGSGSDRIAECAEILGLNNDQLIVGLQGDEPDMPPECLDQLATMLAEDQTGGVATLYWPIESSADVLNPNVVKVVCDHHGVALYFSRSPIPHYRGDTSAQGITTAIAAGVRWKRHVGVYAYRLAALKEFAASAPAELETLERLEQLRFMALGRRVLVARAQIPVPAGVDTAEDLARARLSRRQPGA